MATPIPATQLAHRIQTLLEQRQEHVDAIAQIDQTLSGVGAALGGPVSKNGRKSAAGAAPAKAPKSGKRRRGRGNFALSAEESILAFVNDNESPSTQDVNAHFQTEGRASTADNALSKLVREKRLKRVPLGDGIRGSRYLIP